MLQSRKGWSTNSDSEGLKLKNQLCFPLYACSKEMIRKYKPFLEELGLTYTQYIAMLVLWDTNSINVKSLGEQLYLDSGTLTPMLKKMEAAGIISRSRDSGDERNVIVTITEAGMKLKDRAAAIPARVKSDLPLSAQEDKQLYDLLYKLINEMTSAE